MDLIAFQQIHLRHSKKNFKPLRINLSFWTETFPETIKIAKRIPVFKKDDNLGCNNCRTILLLPNLSKIFGKLMHHRLTL